MREGPSVVGRNNVYVLDNSYFSFYMLIVCSKTHIYAIDIDGNNNNILKL